MLTDVLWKKAKIDRRKKEWEKNKIGRGKVGGRN